jgi:hypothetical protein
MRILYENTHEHLEYPISKTGRNQSIDFRNLKSEKLNCEDTLPQGLSEARRGNEVFSLSSIRRGGAPPGAAAFVTDGGMGVSTPIIILGE